MLKKRTNQQKNKMFDTYILNAIIKNNHLLANILLKSEDYKIQNAENAIKNLDALLEKV